MESRRAPSSIPTLHGPQGLLMVPRSEVMEGQTEFRRQKGQDSVGTLTGMIVSRGRVQLMPWRGLQEPLGWDLSCGLHRASFCAPWEPDQTLFCTLNLFRGNDGEPALQVPCVFIPTLFSSPGLRTALLSKSSPPPPSHLECFPELWGLSALLQLRRQGAPCPRLGRRMVNPGSLLTFHGPFCTGLCRAQWCSKRLGWSGKPGSSPGNDRRP